MFEMVAESVTEVPTVAEVGVTPPAERFGCAADTVTVALAVGEVPPEPVQDTV